jgi:hypothetical protein
MIISQENKQKLVAVPTQKFLITLQLVFRKTHEQVFLNTSCSFVASGWHRRCHRLKIVETDFLFPSWHLHLFRLQ